LGTGVRYRAQFALKRLDGKRVSGVQPFFSFAGDPRTAGYCLFVSIRYEEYFCGHRPAAKSADRGFQAEPAPGPRQALSLDLAVTRPAAPIFQESHLPDPIRTARLTLFAATSKLLKLELESPALLGTALCAEVPADWPPGEYDTDAMNFFLGQMEERGEEVAGWLGWYAVAHATELRPATLVGSGGFMGPPDAHGSAEIGYSISEQWRGQGFATELVGGLIQRAQEAGVWRLTARTLASNPASIAVLERNGFSATVPTDTHLVFERALTA